MINPEEFEGAITGLRFLCGCTSSNRQYTFVEITVEDRIERPVTVTFCVPEKLTSRNEFSLMEAMSANGGGIVNEAMDAWGECRTDSALRSIAVSASIDNNPSTMSSEVSGCSSLVSITVPSGGECLVNACWSHEVCERNAIIVPTFNECLTSWRVDAIVMQGNTHNHGKPPKHSFSRSFRHDIASLALIAVGEKPFLPCDNAMLLRRWGPSLPYHNIYVSMRVEKTHEHHSLCGALLVDKTSRMMMTFYDVMFVAIPCICGAYIRNSISYPRCFVPLTISERLCRKFPVEFHDASDGSACVDIHIEGIPMYRIDPRKRVVHETLYWVDIVRLSDI